ncbi:MAG: hypothetical protein PQJ59_18925 [Spirochaetales bacterium]|nr:hypothetical protein [Spirochaetales bacterium]
MTLNTSLIEKESRELYLRYLKDPGIPDDLCSDIYLEFLKRMKKERERGNKKISGSGIGHLIKLATSTVFHNKRQEEDKEHVLSDIINKNASRLWCKDQSPEERQFFEKIALYLKDWAQQKKNNPQYLRLFLVYHAFHISLEFIETLAPSTDVERETLFEQIEEIKGIVRQRANKQLD